MAAAIHELPFSIEDFLRTERDKDLLRFSTAGSVDDGKSTLIGRLLYDTQSVYDDQVRSIEGKGTTAPGQIDFALLTDGLRAEREQGITIDVAYRYFSTPKRKFIIADTPGHEQYTRNMATGASTADAAIVLIDARKGVLVQSRRHAYIASLLGVRHLIVAVNKMDLVSYDKQTFKKIAADFTEVLTLISADTRTAVHPIFIPVSALAGDNIVHRSGAMDWYDGPSLLALLESLPVTNAMHTAPFRFPVQRVLRPNQDFRGFAGQIASGTIRPGDTVIALPSGRSANVARIVTFDGDLDHASAPLSVTIVLDRELDISRGDLLSAAESPAVLSENFKASVVWMDSRPLNFARRYLLKHSSQTVTVTIEAVNHRTDIGTLARQPAIDLKLNNIGVITVKVARPLAIDLYADNRRTGAFILIDPESNGTVAAGMIIDLESSSSDRSCSSEVTAADRAAKWGHCGALLQLDGPLSLINRIEYSLFDAGAITTRADSSQHLHSLEKLGLIVLLITESPTDTLSVTVSSRTIILSASDPEAAVSAVHQLLIDAGIFTSRRKVGG